MSKLNKFIGFLPPIFVILVSAAAFVPGFLVSDVKDNVEIAQSDLDDAQLDYDYFVQQANFVFEYDSNIYGQMWDRLQTIKELEVEWTNLGSNATEMQNNTYVGLMLMHFGVVNVLAQQTFSFYIDTDLTNNPAEIAYDIGESSTGSPYAINRDDWETHPVLLRTTLGEFLNDTYREWYADTGFFSNSTMEYFETNNAEELDSDFVFLYAEDTLFTLDRRSNLYTLTQLPIFRQAELIHNVNLDIYMTQEKVNNYQTIVSVMTVATILATAMASRMEERKIAYKVSVLRADFNDNDSMIIGEVDKFSLLILAIALLIAVAALVFVLWV